MPLLPLPLVLRVAPASGGADGGPSAVVAVGAVAVMVPAGWMMNIHWQKSQVRPFSDCFQGAI